MVYLYLLIIVIAVPIVGVLVNRRSDGAYRRTARWGSMKPFGFSRFGVDPVENPRPVDDGTQYGYKEFD
jgi:hypothetical protein